MEARISLAPWLILTAIGLVVVVLVDKSDEEALPEPSPAREIAARAVEPVRPARSSVGAREPEDIWSELPEIGPEQEVQHSRSVVPATYSYSWYEGAEGFLNGVEEAQREGKALVVYFYTDWCPYCKELDRELLSRAGVEDYLKYLVKIRVNPERGPGERALKRQYGVSGYPSLFIQKSIKAWPNKIGRMAGDRMKTPEEFVASLERAVGSG